MFKKRGARSNFRRKGGDSSDEEEKGAAGGGGVSIGAVSLGRLSARNASSGPAVPASRSAAAMLSFADEEDEDSAAVAAIRLKKSAQKRLGRLKKAVRERPPSPDSSTVEPPPPSPPPPPPPPPQKAPPAPQRHEFNAERRKDKDAIPDARAIFMARKRRQAVREGADVVPLDDTQRYSSHKGRLVREEEEDENGDSGEEGGRFYSKVGALRGAEEERRRGEEEFLEVEQGDAEDSEEEEFAQWEIDRIRKSLPNEVASQMESAAEASRRKRTYAQFGALGPPPSGDSLTEQAMEIENVPDLAPSTENIPLPSAQNGHFQPKLGGGDPPPPAKSINLPDLVAKLKVGLRDNQELIRAKEMELDKLCGHETEAETTLAGLEAKEPKLQAQFQLFQDSQAFVRDLLECLGEKTPAMEDLSARLEKLIAARTEGLRKRRRQETLDEFSALSSGKAGAEDGGLALRAAEREGRRSRRRQEREKRLGLGGPRHHDGDSTDDEELPSKVAAFQADMAALRDDAAAVMGEALEEFSSAAGVLGTFDAWLRDDPDSFREAYIALTFPQLLQPLVQQELLSWNPFGSVPAEALPPRRLSEMSWYSAALRLGGEAAGTDESCVELVPALVEKVVLPQLTRLVRASWEPGSRRQSRELVRVLQELRAFPGLDGESERLNALLAAVHGRLKEVVDEELFTPLLTASQGPTAAAFLDRQFWAALKVLEVGLSLWGLLSTQGVEEVAVDGVLNRHLVLSLQTSPPEAPETLTKVSALMGALPHGWPPTETNRDQLQPLANLLARLAREHPKEARRQLFDHLQRLLGKTAAAKMAPDFGF